MLTTDNTEISNGEQLKEAEITARQLIERAPNSCRAYEALAMALEAQHKKAEALSAYRHAFSLGTDPATYRDQVEQLIYETRSRAELRDFGISIDARILPPTILICSIPSTFSNIITQILSRVLGYNINQVSSATYQNEQSLDIIQMATKLQEPTVVNQAVRPTECNLHRIQSFYISPVIYLENIFDVLIDIRDKFKEDNELGLVSPNYTHYSPINQLETIIHHWGFWYVEFFASWVIAAKDKRCNVMFLTKEQLISEAYEQVRKIITHSNAALNHDNADVILQNEVCEVQINSTYEQKPSHDDFQEEHIRQLRSFTRYYRDIDFSLIGL